MNKEIRSPDLDMLTEQFKAFAGNQELMIQLLDMLPIPIEVFAPDGLSIFANRAGLELNNYTLNFTMPALFSDDAMISGLAKNSVCFMAANTVIKGDNGKFMPRAVTEAEIAMDYALAAREHALIMALRITENLADKPLDYKVT